MRPIIRGESPLLEDFKPYSKAKPFLISRMGNFCSYCEKPIKTGLAVEHIQPKGLEKYKHLTGSWHNFLLGCTNCNSTKLNKDVVLTNYILPDRDNTFLAYQYSPDGKVIPSPKLNSQEKSLALATLSLVGLDKKIKETKDENEKLVAIDRVSQRMEIWAVAQQSKELLAISPIDSMKKMIINLSLATGHFSIWMTVFGDDLEMRQLFLDNFPGTSKGCFDENTIPVSPRPQDHTLPHGSKV